VILQDFMNYKYSRYYFGILLAMNLVFKSVALDKFRMENVCLRYDSSWI
jgi:hypothetical protein